MASHARKQLRDAVLTALRALPTTGANVYQSRATPLTQDELPGIVIVMPSEQSAVSAGDAASKQDRVAQLLVIGMAEDAQPEDTIDQIAAEVEAALLADPTLGGLAKNVSLDSTVKDIGDGQQETGEVRLVFSVLYRTAQGVPTTIIS